MDEHIARKVRLRRRRRTQARRDGSVPYQAHSVTSRQAAKQVKGSAATLRAKVFDFITRSGGATDEEIQDGLGMNPNTQRPRRRELQQKGLVEDSGHVRATRSGRKAVVWRAT